MPFFFSSSCTYYEHAYMMLVMHEENPHAIHSLVLIICHTFAVVIMLN